MSTAITRQLIRLRLTFAGHVPEIWRDIDIDPSLPLSDLRRVISRLFEAVACRHYVFFDNIDEASSCHVRRRWGDRWTMIDLRDPMVIDEATAQIESVFEQAGELAFRHTCRTDGLIVIEALGAVPAAWGLSTPGASVSAGARRAPLPCCRGPIEHDALVAVLADPAHPARDDLVAALERTVGPWTPFDPEAFDAARAGRALDDTPAAGAPARGRARPVHATALDHLCARLPRSARAGWQQHIAESGLDLPAVVTADEARAATKDFRWIIASATDGGIALIDGAADPTVVRAGAAALACAEEYVLRLIVLARRGHLLYSRSGRLHANKKAIAAAETPMELWALLARQLVRGHVRGDADDLLLLAIADGSLSDREIGARYAARVLASITGRNTLGGWGYHGGRDERDQGCDQRCDCPAVGGETWHDVVARGIRESAADVAGGDAAPVLAGISEDMANEYEFPADWLGPPTAHVSRPWGRHAADDMSTDEATFVAASAELVDLLAIFGLGVADDGSWSVPPVLREFAREALRSPPRWGSGSF